MNGAVWDLDTVDAREDWILGLLSQQEMTGVPHVPDLFAIGHGTVVLWDSRGRLRCRVGGPERVGRKREASDYCAVRERVAQHSAPRPSSTECSFRRPVYACFTRTPVLANASAKATSAPLAAS
jgi:hypothetical protein